MNNKIGIHTNKLLSSVKSEQENLLLNEYIIKIESLIRDEKVYLNTKFKLTCLAKLLNLSVHKTSEVINSGYNHNFYTLVNRFRVEEAKFKLIEGYCKNITIEGVGLECGFGSPATFYRVFKIHTGLTPKQYLDNIEASALGSHL